MGVAQAQCQIEPVGEVDDIMREKRPILTLLPVDGRGIAGAAGNGGERAQPIAKAGRDRARLRCGKGWGQAGIDEGCGQARIQIGLRAGDQRLGGKAAAAGGELLRGEIAGRTVPCHQATGGKAAIVGAEPDIIL